MIASKRLLQYLALVCFLGLLPMLALAAPSVQPPELDKIDRELLDEVSINGEANFWIQMAVQADLNAAYDLDWEARGWYVYNTLRKVARDSQSGVVAELRAQGLKYQSFWINNSIYIQGGNLSAIQGLAVRSDVARIKSDGIIYLPEPPAQVEGVQGFYDSWGLDWVNAPEVWGEGYDGSGIVVANIDTGVQYDHPQLFNTYRGTIEGTDEYNWCDPSNICAGDVPCDNNGHGTHTMGTLTGSNDVPVSNPNVVGIAPGSTWMACKGCESTYCTDEALLECAEWILAPTDVLSGACGSSGTANPGKRPHIVNNSWGDVGGDNWYRASVQAWQAAGIFPAFSAGNENYCGSAGSPGDYPESFSSANIQMDGTIHPYYSSRGPSSFERMTNCKPNIAAPGTNICSTVPGNGYSCGYTGTSMASPHSAGTVALLWQACPELVGQVEATFQVLESTAAAPPADTKCAAIPGCGNAGCNCTYGSGYLDAYAAVQSCAAGQELGHLDGFVYDADTLDPIEGANVAIAPVEREESDAGAAFGIGVDAVTDASGYYTATLPPGTYTALVSKNGYLPEQVTDIEVTADTVASQDFYLAYVGVWTQLALPPSRPMEYNRFDGVFDPHDNLVYFPGGRTGPTSHDTSIWTYDPVHDAWADTGCDMIRNAANITAAYVEDDGTGRGEAIYVVGGYDAAASKNISAVQRYYPSEPGCLVEVVTTDPFPGIVGVEPVGAGGVAVVEDRIYYFGGWQTEAGPYFSDKTWLFDPKAPSGNRWTEVAGASLSPGRSYINVAVQNGLIYAMGGIADYYPYPVASLIPTDTVEVLDPASPGNGWATLANLPTATAEGRGFGFGSDTVSLNQPDTTVYVAGGGKWPDPSSRVYEYDVATNSWGLHFPVLNQARKNHAGAFVAACTPDPDDGLPGMWVFGGQVSTVDGTPPFGDPEYFGFSCLAPDPPRAALTVQANGFEITSGRPLTGCQPLAVRFTDVSSGTVLERSWDFGDQSPYSTAWRPLHVYDATGAFTYTLSVSNTSGSDLITGTILISATPSAAFGFTPTNVLTSTLVHFVDQSTGDIREWRWQFSDGYEYSIPDPVHRFLEPGTYTVTLTVTGASGCPASASADIRVYPIVRTYFFPIAFQRF